jgi:hypothetical protein
MRKIFIGLLLAMLLALAGTAWGGTPKNVYLKDGGRIEAESFWRKGDIVYVLVNRDTLVELPQGEVDLKKTFVPGKAASKKKKAVAVKPAAVKPDTAAGATTAVAAEPTTEPARDTPAKPGAAPPKTKAAPTTEPATSPAPAAGKPTPPASPQAAPEAPKPPPAAAPEPASTPSMPTPPAIPEVPAAGVGMALAAMGMVPLVILGLVLLLFLVTFWKIFEKAGEAGWKSLIPIYNVFIMLKIAGKPWWWFLLFLIPVVNIIFNLLWCLALAQKFGKSQLFGVGLFLLGFICFPILAFDSSRYEG